MPSTFLSGGFRRDDTNAIAVMNADGTPISGGTALAAPLQFKDAGTPIDAPGTAARGLLIDPSSARLDGGVVDAGRIVNIVGGSDGSNWRALKTSAAGVLQVDVLSGGGGGAAGTQYAEDAALGATPTGTLAMARRIDTLGTLTPVVDDAVSLRTNNRGAQWVVHDGALPITDNDGSLTVDGSVTVVGSVTADTELTTADLDTGAGTDTRAVIGLVRAESGGGLLVGSANPLPVTGPLTDTQLRATPVPVSGTVTANAGSGPFPVSDNGGSLTVDAPVGTPVFTRLSDGTAALVGQKTMANSLPVTLASDQSALAVSGPLTDTQLRASAVPVSLAANQSVNVAQLAGTATDTNSGNKSAGTQRIVIATDQPALTNALKVDGSAVTQPVSGTVTASNTTGNVAHDGADSGNPVKVGARALSADITAVATGDRVDNVASLLGKQVLLPYALPASSTQGSANYTTTTAADVIAAPGAGIRLYITEVTVTNAHATVGTKVEIRDGTTVRKSHFAAANGGGFTLTMPTPLRLAANAALTARCVTTGADVDVSATGYTAAE